MDIVLMKNYKRHNSTYIFDTTAILADYITVSNCRININTDVVSVDIVLPSYKNGIKTNYIRYNYIYVQELSRYYWVYDWHINTDGTCVASCVIDVLTTYKSFILNSDAYIMRTSNTAIADPTIPDGFYNAISKYTTVEETLTMQHYSADPRQGCFVVSCIVNNSPEYGAVNYYVITRTQLATLVANLVNNSSLTNTNPDAWKTATLGADIIKSLASPLQYILSCKWFPFNPPNVAAQDEIICGPWHSGAYGIKLVGDGTNGLNPFSGNNNDVYTYHTIDIPKITAQTEGYGDIHQYPPYAKYTFISPTFGTFEIDPNVCCYNDNLIIDITTNFITGLAKLTLSYYGNPSDTPSSQNLQTLTQKIVPLAVNIPLAQITENYLDATKSVVNAASSAAQAAINPFTAGSNIGSAVNSSLDAIAYCLSPGVSSKSEAGMAFWHDIDTVKIQAQFQHTTPQTPSEYGVPYNTYDRLNTHNGYFVTAVDFHPVMRGASYPTAPLKKEYDMIVQYLREGVYLE